MGIGPEPPAHAQTHALELARLSRLMLSPTRPPPPARPDAQTNNPQQFPTASAPLPLYNYLNARAIRPQRAPRNPNMATKSEYFQQYLTAATKHGLTIAQAFTLARLARSTHRYN